MENNKKKMRQYEHLSISRIEIDLETQMMTGSPQQLNITSNDIKVTPYKENWEEGFDVSFD